MIDLKSRLSTVTSKEEWAARGILVPGQGQGDEGGLVPAKARGRREEGRHHR